MESISAVRADYPRSIVTWRRILIALLVVLLLHLLFFIFVAPYLEFDRNTVTKTEVTQISPQELDRLKKKILKDKYLNPLLKQEQRKEFKTDTAPDDAKMMSDFNQKVPKEQLARAQHDAPQEGGGGAKAAQKARPQPQQKLNLSQLGLGSKVPPPASPEEQKQQRSAQGPPGPRGPYVPRGLDMNGGDQNLLNAAESKFYSFFLRLEEPIIRNWFFILRSNEAQIRGEMAAHKIQAGAELPITVEFVLDRQGNFRSIDIIESSSITSLDNATKEAVKKLGSLPNPPPDLFEGGQYYTRRLRFMVHVTEAPVINSRPDLYW